MRNRLQCALLYCCFGFALFFSEAQGFASDADALTQALKFLPEPIRKFKAGKTSQAEILKSLGAPFKNKGQWLYRLDSHPYDTSLTIKNGKAVGLRFSGASLHTIKLSQLRSWVPDEAIQAGYRTMNEGSPSHDRGELLMVKLPDQGIELEFSATVPPRLHSIYLYPAREKKE